MFKKHQLYMLLVAATVSVLAENAMYVSGGVISLIVNEVISILLLAMFAVIVVVVMLKVKVVVVFGINNNLDESCTNMLTN